MLSDVIFGPLAHTRGSVLDALEYQGRSPWLVRSQVDDRELWARHAVPRSSRVPDGCELQAELGGGPCRADVVASDPNTKSLCQIPRSRSPARGVKTVFRAGK